MSCKCKNIIQNFEGGVIPLTTTFLSPVYFSGNTYHNGSIFSGGTNLLDIFCQAPCGGGGAGTLQDVLTAGSIGTVPTLIDIRSTGANNFFIEAGNDLNLWGTNDVNINSSGGNTVVGGQDNVFITTAAVAGTMKLDSGDIVLTAQGELTIPSLSSGSAPNSGDVISAKDSFGNLEWIPIVSGGGAFTGNTSATCINELWVSTISGCSPVTLGPEVYVDGPVTITASGTTQPVFNVLGSSGQLFAINDSLIGELFSVNDISGIPILSVNSNNNILMGDFDAPSLNTTLKKIVHSGVTTLYDIPTSAYTSAYFDYNIVGNGSARAGNVMTIWSGTSLTYSETSTSDIGDTSPVTLSVSFAGSNTSFIASATTNNWVVKSIVRSI